MPETKPDAKHSGEKKPRLRSKREVIDEAIRLGHEIGVRAHAIESSPHPVLALEQLEAELEYACHLARDVRRLIAEQA